MSLGMVSRIYGVRHEFTQDGWRVVISDNGGYLHALFSNKEILGENGCRIASLRYPLKREDDPLRCPPRDIENRAIVLMVAEYSKESPCH